MIHYYDELIRTRGSQDKPEGYSERHHIVPKWLGGTDDDTNLVYLSFKDHVFAHWLLWRIHRDKPSAYSYYMMSKRKKANPNPTVEQFAQTNKGRVMSQASKDKISLTFKGKKKPEGFGDNLSRLLNEKHHLSSAVQIDGVTYSSNRKAAAILGISHRTVGRMIKRGDAFNVSGKG
jgi:hypothetical protein